MTSQPRSRSERRFFLASAPENGQARLAPEDQEHALRVLRVEPGERVMGLDGQGRAWPLEITAVEKRSLTLEVRGEATCEPPPGEPGSPLPWIAVALALPKPARQTETLDRLTQLGASRILPIATERTSQGSRELSRNRLERLERVTREACKQSRRLWTAELEPVATLEATLAAAPGEVLRLDPGGARSLHEFAGELPGDARPTLFVGPEGGFTEAECDLMDSRGAATCRLTPTILRIETAAELAVGTLAQVLGEKRRRELKR